MEAPPLPPAPLPPHPPPHPPPDLTSALARLRSLLSAASSALAALPSPLLPHATSPRPSVPSHQPPTTTTIPTPPLPPPATAITVPLPAAPAPYADCPAVVRTTPTPIPAVSSLPAVIAAECADFSSSSTAQIPSSPPPRILPSELSLLRRELDSWGAGGHHLPGSYSYAVSRVAAAFRLGVTPRWEVDLREWVLGSSPRYGVKVSVAEADHIWVLLWLCLKVMAAEAGCSLEGMHINGDVSKGVGFDPRAMRFECPRLVEGVSWLGAQLGVLYGESNGRLFALAAVKEAVLQMAYCLAVGVGAAGGGEGEVGAGGGAGDKGSDAGDDVAGPVFLSQVAAAIVSLYERFSLEEKTKALRAQRPSKYHLLIEYSQALERGNLERSNRPNYRAVLEYDGILSRRIENQESARAKSKEELLAEERDYKRRRASYRGKKVNRNPTEVLRDIIDEHMEEIKQAGGIGCLVEGPADIAPNVLKSNSHGGTYQGSNDFSSSSSHDKAALSSWSSGCNKSPRSDSLEKFSSRSRDTRDSYKAPRYENHGKRYLSENENRWSVGSESEIDHSYPYQQENHRRQRSSDDNRNYGYKKDVSDHHPESSSARSQRSSVTEYARMSREGSSDRSRASQKRHRSLSVTQDHFSDRYDPQNTYSGGDPPTGMLCDTTEEAHHRRHHERKHDHHQ